MTLCTCFCLGWEAIITPLQQVSVLNNDSSVCSTLLEINRSGCSGKLPCPYSEAGGERREERGWVGSNLFEMCFNPELSNRIMKAKSSQASAAAFLISQDDAEVRSSTEKLSFCRHPTQTQWQGYPLLSTGVPKLLHMICHTVLPSLPTRCIGRQTVLLHSGITGPGETCLDPEVQFRLITLNTVHQPGPECTCKIMWHGVTNPRETTQAGELHNCPVQMELQKQSLYKRMQNKNCTICAKL